MEDKNTFMYDEDSDRLMISCKKENDIIDGSIRILNLILDITTTKKVANIELLDASSYLESLGINPDILNKLTGAGMSLKTLRNGYLITILLKTGKKAVYVPYNIHIPYKRQIEVISS